MDWIRQYYDKESELIGYVRVNGQDMSNLQGLFLANQLTTNDFRAHFYFSITKKNVLPMCMYLAVRLCIDATWLNDRDQFLFPNDGWQSDREFQADCLAFTLFHGQNRISCAQGVNNWIPFTEDQVGSKKAFKSNFMSSFIADFLAGKVCASSGDLFDGGVAGAA